LIPHLKDALRSEHSKGGKDLKIFAVALCGLVFSSLGFSAGAVFVFVYLSLSIYSNLSTRFDSFTALSGLFSGAIILSSTVYLFSQHVQALSHELIRVLVYGTLAACIYINKKDRAKNYRSSQIVGAFFFITSQVWSLIPLSKLISFLGFGYDNYAHLYIFRQTLVKQQSLFAYTNPGEVVSFVGATPLGTSNLLALIAEVIGIDGTQIHESISFFTFAVCTFPILILVVTYLSFKSTQISNLRVWTGTLLVGSVVLIGYPSHIWFSGYMTSNFSTFLLALSVCSAIFGKSNGSKIYVLALLGIAQFVVYPLYAIFSIVPFAVVLISNKGEVVIHLYKTMRENVLGYIALSIYLSILTFIALQGMLSGYGGSQFLVPGGIAPLPVGTSMFIFGISIALSITSKHHYFDNSINQMTVFGITTLAIAGISYSFLRTNEPGKLWTPSYYPTKLAISVLIVMVILLIIQMMQKFEVGDSKIRHSLIAFLVVAALSSLVVASYNTWPFSQGYMGTTEGVIKSLRSQKSEVVDGESVLQAYEFVKNSKLSALYLSDDHESELNTRWINTLNLNWNDMNWGKWMMNRQLIEEGKIDEASQIMNNDFVLLIDNYSQFRISPNSFNAFNNLCIIDLERLNSCQDK